MSFSQKPLVDERKAAFARLASRVLETLNDAVSTRREQGQTISAIADKIGCNRSSVTRALNGTSPNLTLRTISDILWATDFDPQDFAADPIESISPNWLTNAVDVEAEVEYISYPTKVVRLTQSSVFESGFQKTKFEFAPI